jgi:hypothetical protein
MAYKKRLLKKDKTINIAYYRYYYNKLSLLAL